MPDLLRHKRYMNGTYRTMLKHQLRTLISKAYDCIYFEYKCIQEIQIKGHLLMNQLRNLYEISNILGSYPPTLTSLISI